MTRCVAIAYESTWEFSITNYAIRAKVLVKFKIWWCLVKWIFHITNALTDVSRDSRMCVECFCEALRDDWRKLRLIWAICRLNDSQGDQGNYITLQYTLITRKYIIKTLVSIIKWQNCLLTSSGFQKFKSNAISRSTPVDFYSGRHWTNKHLLVVWKFIINCVLLLLIGHQIDQASSQWRHPKLRIKIWSQEPMEKSFWRWKMRS